MARLWTGLEISRMGGAMKVIRALAALRAAHEGGDLGFVPTMGALHAGHIALVAAARAAHGRVAASIFVNPTQFGPNEDFLAYPRTEDEDLAKLEAAGCDLVWMPDVATMYPADAATSVHVGGPARRWEGEIRPGHFNGVATVVAKLFGQVRPSAAYFGEKDWQQIQVIRRMVEDLPLPVRIVPIPTIREADGLALSSRNRFLAPPERARAPALHRTLAGAARALAAGAPIEATLDDARKGLRAAGLAPDYFALVDARSLEPLAAIAEPARLLAAARLGRVRLLDNLAV